MHPYSSLYPIGPKYPSGQFVRDLIAGFTSARYVRPRRRRSRPRGVPDIGGRLNVRSRSGLMSNEFARPDISYVMNKSERLLARRR